MIIIIIIGLFLSLALLSSILAFQPIYAQEQIRLEAITDQGTFKVEIMWTSNDIGTANEFELHFIDPDTGSEIEGIKYDISIYRNDKPEIQRLDQTSIFQEFFFEEMGSYEIRIEDIEGLGERAIVPIQVTPEFQLKGFVLPAAAVLSIAMLAARQMVTIYLGTPSIKRNDKKRILLLLHCVDAVGSNFRRNDHNYCLRPRRRDGKNYR